MVHNMFSKSKCENIDNNFTNDSFNMLHFCNCIEIHGCVIFISAMFIFLLIIFIINFIYFNFIIVHILIYNENKIFSQEVIKNFFKNFFEVQNNIVDKSVNQTVINKNIYFP